jgi:hypothetical protein
MIAITGIEDFAQNVKGTGRNHDGQIIQSYFEEMSLSLLEGFSDLSN